MAITKLTKHNDCEITIRKLLPDHMHFAELRCVDCNKHIQWLSERDFFLVVGTDINNNNNNITTNNNIIISVGKADTDNDQVFQTSFGLKQAKGETPDSEGVRVSAEVAQ